MYNCSSLRLCMLPPFTHPTLCRKTLITVSRESKTIAHLVMYLLSFITLEGNTYVCIAFPRRPGPPEHCDCPTPATAAHLLHPLYVGRALAHTSSCHSDSVTSLRTQTQETAASSETPCASLNHNDHFSASSSPARHSPSRFISNLCSPFANTKHE